MTRLALLADEHVPSAVITALSSNGFDVVAVARQHAGIDDETVLSLPSHGTDAQSHPSHTISSSEHTATRSPAASRNSRSSVTSVPFSISAHRTYAAS